MTAVGRVVRGEGRRRFDVAKRGEDEQSGVGEVAQDKQRRLVAPVDVVEDDDQATLTVDATHRLGHAVEDPKPVLRRLDITSEHGCRHRLAASGGPGATASTPAHPQLRRHVPTRRRCRRPMPPSDAAGHDLHRIMHRRTHAGKHLP